MPQRWEEKFSEGSLFLGRDEVRPILQCSDDRSVYGTTFKISHHLKSMIAYTVVFKTSPLLIVKTY